MLFIKTVCNVTVTVIVTCYERVLFFQKYKEFERAVRVEEIDGLRLVKRLAEDMEEMFHKKAQAMRVLASIAQYLSCHAEPKLSLELRRQNSYTTNN